MSQTPDHAETTPIDLLIVEDNHGDIRLLREAFKAVETEHVLHIVTDGEEALDFVHQNGPYASAPRPDLILLDLNVPVLSGIDVLKEIKSDPDLTSIPVIVLTGSEAKRDVIESYRNHSNACLIKPSNHKRFFALFQSFEDFWMNQVKLPQDMSPDTAEH